jgi:DNA-binding IscR family transcriptional regulator
MLAIIARATERIKVADIAETLGISSSHADVLAKLLRTGGFIQGVRGPGGGYLLNGEPQYIDLEEVATRIALSKNDGEVSDQPLSLTMQAYLSYYQDMTLQDFFDRLVLYEAYAAVKLARDERVAV